MRRTRAQLSLRKQSADVNAEYSMFDQSETDPNRVNIHSQPGIAFSSSALPGQAKVVMRRTKFSKRRENTDALTSEPMSDEEDETHADFSTIDTTTPTFGEFLPANAIQDVDLEATLLSLLNTMESTLASHFENEPVDGETMHDLIAQYYNISESMLNTDKFNYAELMKRLETMIDVFLFDSCESNSPKLE